MERRRGEQPMRERGRPQADEERLRRRDLSGKKRLRMGVAGTALMQDTEGEAVRRPLICYEAYNKSCI